MEKMIRFTKRLKNRWEVYKNSEKPLKIEWILSTVILSATFFTMDYYDNRYIFETTILKLQAISEQSFFSLFSDWGLLPYGLIHNLMCAIWALPVYFLNIIGGMPTGSVGALLWYKLFAVFFFYLDIYLLGKIAQKLKIDAISVKWIQFFFSTTLLVALPVFHIAQTDAVYLFFILMGFNTYLENKYAKFLFWFALAIPMKYIPFFIFIPLVLLKEKKILYIGRDLLAGISIIILERIINKVSLILVKLFYYTSEDQSEFVSNFLSGNLSRVFGTRMDVIYSKGIQASVFIIFFILLCVWSYLQHDMDRSDFEKKAVYCAFAGIAPMFVFGSTPVYWIMIIFPFLFIMIYQNRDIFLCNMVLVNTFVLPYFYISTITNSWVLGGSKTFDNLLLAFVRKKQEDIGQVAPCFYDYLAKYGLDQFSLIAASIATASLIALLIINSSYVKVKETVKDVRMYQHGFAWFNIVILVGWYLINLITVLNVI